MSKHTHTYRLATWNLGDGDDDRKRRGLDRMRNDGAVIINLQETADRGFLLRDWADRYDFNLYLGDCRPGAASVAQLVHRSVPVERVRSRTAVGRRIVGFGAGPAVAKPKVVNLVRVTGLPVLNTHFVASATRKGSRFSLRRLHYALHMTVVVGMVLRRRRVVVACDANAPWNHPLLRRLRRVARKATRRPTHGRRSIDNLWGRGVEFTAVEVLQMPSDHHAVVATVTTKTRGKR